SCSRDWSSDVCSSDLPRSHSANSCLAYQKSVITRSSLEWLKLSIGSIETESLSMVHGGWNNHEDEYIFKVTDDYFNNYPQRYFRSEEHTSELQSREKL